MLNAPFGSVFPSMANSNNSSTLALSTANTWGAYSWNQAETKIITGFMFNVSALSGTASLVSATLELQADSAGSPSGTALDTTVMPAGSFTIAGWYEAVFAGGVLLTAGLRYWVVIKPIATNYPTLQNWPSFFPGTDRFARKSSTDGVPTWSAATSGQSGFLPKFSDGYLGFSGYSGGVINAGVQNRFYNGSEVGAKFISPDCTLQVIGINAILRRFINCGNLVFKLYLNNSLKATTFTIPQYEITTAAITISANFSSPIQIPPKSNVRITATTDGGDSASNYGGLNGGFYNTALPQNSPLAGNLMFTRLAAGSWVDTPGTIPTIQMILHEPLPVAPAPLNRRKFNNQR